MKRIIPILWILTPSVAYAEDLPPCPPPYTLCLTEEQRTKVIEAVKELDKIKNSDAELEFIEPIVIIRDWEDRVYVNGGEKNPIKLKLKLGSIDRDLVAELPIQLSYREEPEDPAFRFRLRAQFGVLAPEVIRSIKDKEFEVFYHTALAIDFLHYDIWNFAINAGTAGFGIGTGIDITKNFGTNVDFLIKYDKIYPEFMPTMNLGVYFALY